MLEILLLSESYHHAKRRQAANQNAGTISFIAIIHRLPAVKRLSIIVFDMQNRIQSQTFGVIISCQTIDVFLLKHCFAQLDLKHIQINHSGNLWDH